MIASAGLLAAPAARTIAEVDARVAAVQDQELFP